jgi:LacI family transcriptional regulator
LKDIAQRAGVSAALVSYVLNNSRVNRVNKETAQRVRDIACELNYNVNQLARSLKTNKTNTLGLIVSNIGNPFSASLARIIENVSAQKQYTTIFGSSDEDVHKFENLVNTFVNRKVDGLLLSPPEGSEHIITKLQQQGIPLVLVDRYFPAIKTSYVALDNFTASLQATEYLINSGRQRPAMIGYKTGLFHLQDRNRGFITALKKHGIPFLQNMLQLVGVGDKKTSIETAIDQLLKMEPGIDALLLGSNTIATCGLRYLNKLPIKVPAELSLISFDQAEMLDVFYSPVTYVKQPLEEIGRLAIEAMLTQLEDPAALTEINLTATLVVQDSTGEGVEGLKGGRVEG